MNKSVIHGEINNAASATEATIYLAGSTTARTLASNETLYISHVTFSSDQGTAAVSISAGADAGGTRIWATGVYTASDIIEIRIDPPYQCPAGVLPRVTNAGGANNFANFQGYIDTSDDINS